MRPQDHHNTLSSQSPIFYLPFSQTLPLTLVPWAPALLIVDPICALTIKNPVSWQHILLRMPERGWTKRGKVMQIKSEWYKQKMGEAEWEESNGLVWTEREWMVNKRLKAMGFTISFKLQTIITVIWRSKTYIMSKFKKKDLGPQP